MLKASNAKPEAWVGVEMNDERRSCGTEFFRALRCTASRQAKTGVCPNTRKPRVSGAPACREQLRAGLRRKEGSA